MRIYLDNCCYNRPFDNQMNARIRVETEAKLAVQQGIKDGKIELAWSYILDYENSANPYSERRKTIAQWREFSIIDTEEHPSILKIAVDLKKKGLTNLDALHIAAALHTRCTYFITTDDGILNKAGIVKNITILDPSEFVRKVYL